MASTEANPPGGDLTETPSEAIPTIQIQQQTDVLPTGTPVEMSNLPHTTPSSSATPAPTAPTAQDSSTLSESQTPLHSLDGALQSPAPIRAGNAPSPIQLSSSASPPRLQTDHLNPTTTTTTNHPPTSGILSPLPDNAPASAVPLPATTSDGPSVLINLILLNGARHPYKIDQRYLRKRNVNTLGGAPAVEGHEAEIDPFAISIYTLKELIWRDWREEWDPRPAIPGSIRLIYFGRLLEDKQTLKDCKFHATNPNVVHMTVRPQSLVDEEENAKAHHKGGGSMRSRGDGDTQASCCRCIIM